MSKELNFNGKTVVVKELTVAQVTEHLDGGAEIPTTAELLLDRAVPERVVRMATGLTSEEINGNVQPSDLAKLWDGVEEVNPFLSKLQERLTIAGKAVVGALPEPVSGSVPVA